MTTRGFVNSPSSIGPARRFVGAQLAGVPAGVAGEIAVMVSELVTNCVRHTVTDFTVNVDVSGRRIRVEVTDRGGGFPVVRSPDSSEPSGRGLRIVQDLADSFGVNELRGSPGKTVWFEVSLEQRSGASQR